MYSPIDLVGNTPYIKYTSVDGKMTNIFIKLEGSNPTGSVKDRTCIHIINSMLKTGRLKKGMTILDASSGNFASSLAYFGNLMGFATEVVVSSKITTEKKKLIEYFGATVTQVGNFTIEGNQFCRQLIESNNSKQYCFLDQLHNWENPKAHTEKMGPEILRDFPNVSAIVGSLGSGGTMLGVGDYMKQHKPVAKLVAVTAASGTVIPGMGAFDDGDYITPFIRKGFDDRIFDHVVKINKDAATQGTKDLKEAGIFCGPQTGGLLAAVVELVQEGILTGDIVLISGDAGWKNLDKLSVEV